MKKYINNGKTYEVSDITYNGAIIEVNGTDITDLEKKGQLDGLSFGSGFTVFCDSDEMGFATFDKAYEFAMTKQKDTFRL